MKKLCVAFLLLFTISAFAETSSDVQKTMVVVSDEGQLSSLTFIRNNKAFIKLYVSISYQDEMSIWGDLIILDSMEEIKDIEVYIDNYGGDATAGFAIHDLFKRYQGRFNMKVRASGVVASAAVAVFLAFEDRYASENTFFMVHEAAREGRSGERMTASELKTMDDLFDRLKDVYLNILTNNSNICREDWEEKMEETTWFSAKEAKEWGIIKEVQ